MASCEGITVQYTYKSDIEGIKMMLDDGAYAPIRAHSDDAGLDLRACEDRVVPPMGSAIFDTGVHIMIPSGYVGFLKSKSGLNVNHDITGEGVIDAGYAGSIAVKLYNHGSEPYMVRKGDKISQLVILPIAIPSFEIVTEFEETERGSNGFGSSGR